MIIGLFLGFGAPIGALLLRFSFFGAVRSDPLHELERNAFFYGYSLVGTCLAFAFASYLAGRQADRLRRAEEFYHRQSEHDSLTGLFNEGAFRDRLRRAVERAVKVKGQLALLLIDVDHLKQINDAYGHERGSAALQHVTSAMTASKRASDIAARWGGDEFAVLMADADEAAARRIADSIASWLAKTPFGGPKRVAVTIGVAVYVPSSLEDDFFATADKALYAGKRAGRNQVQVLTAPASTGQQSALNPANGHRNPTEPA